MAKPTDLDDFRHAAATWLEQHATLAPRDYGAILPHELFEHGKAWQCLLVEHGWAGIHWPKEHGGQGLTITHTQTWILECARAGVPPFINMVGIVLAGGALLRFGTAEQQQRHLARTLTTDDIWCQLFSEPGAGSDLASLSTRAVKDGERYIVNGQKVWCSGGRYSNWGILMARTNSDAPKHKGISFFLCNMTLPGIEIRPLRQMTGESEFDEVFFTDVELPDTALLGPENEGWNVGMAVLTNERGHIGASVIGLERRLASMSAMAANKNLTTVERDRLIRLLSSGRAYAAMGQRQGAVASTAASLMKLGITEMMFDAAMLRGDLGGPDAQLASGEATGMLSAPGGRIAGGSSQVQRNIIGERLLGLPREPHA